MLLGVAVGDALGGPYEFMSGEQIKQPIEMTGGGWLRLRPGQTTDDTAMMLCIMRVLAEDKHYDQQKVLANYLAWKASGPADIGNTINGALTHIQNGTSIKEAAYLQHRLSGGQTASNGSLMRIAPLALISNKEERHANVIADSTLTHYDDRATKACLQYTDWLATYLADEEVEYDNVWKQEKAFDAANGHIGFVETALGITAWAATEQDFEQTLTTVVSFGGDADTNAAIAGGLLGAKYGLEAIPKRWLETLEDTQMISQLVEQYFN